MLIPFQSLLLCSLSFYNTWHAPESAESAVGPILLMHIHHTSLRYFRQNEMKYLTKRNTKLFPISRIFYQEVEKQTRVSPYLVVPYVDESVKSGCGSRSIPGVPSNDTC
jgi:hypothetical protein